MNSIQKQLTDMVFDINPAEISSHIENDSLRQWCQTWGSKMLEIISSIPFAKDGNYEKGYQDGLNADKWIHCKDRLPDDLSEVIVCLEDGFVTSTLYGFGEFAPKSTITRKFVKGSPVVAWQPLPSIPKEENL